jgi:transcriptional regulator with GAF, ATPase, and Fis domain
MKSPKGKAQEPPKGEDLIRQAARSLAGASKAARLPEDSADAGVVGGLRSLVGVCRQISSIVELRPLLVKIVGEILLLSDTERGFIMLYEGDGSLSFGLGRTRKGGDLEAQEFKISMSTAESVAENAVPIIAAGPEALRAIRDKKSVADLGLKTIICVPLRAPGGVQGVLYADSRSAVPELTTVKTEIVNAFAEQAAVAIENAKQYDRLRESKSELQRQYDRLRREMKRGSGLGPIIGRSAGMLELFDKIEKVASTDAAVLIEGETGTGKELVAKTIHEKSPRGGGPFIAVNCGAIPEGIMESELFGHKRGAFTGATQDREGVFEAANGGTLLLDEISEMLPHLQVKLLRALQEGKITRVGESTTRAVDVRLISATNKNLDEEMAKGTFRSDLYYRLHVVLLRIPPLRERGNDILLLAQYFLDRFADGMGRGPRRVTPESAEALLEYQWAGNVRELENVMEGAAALGPHAEALTLDLLPPNISGMTVGAATIEGGSYKEMLESYERVLLSKALEEHGGNVAKVAAKLKVSKQHVYNRINRLGISRETPEP